MSLTTLTLMASGGVKVKAAPSLPLPAPTPTDNSLSSVPLARDHALTLVVVLVLALVIRSLEAASSFILALSMIALTLELPIMLDLLTFRPSVEEEVVSASKVLLEDLLKPLSASSSPAVAVDKTLT